MNETSAWNNDGDHLPSGAHHPYSQNVLSPPNPSKRPRMNDHYFTIEEPCSFLDLEAYISAYRGRTKILRLLHIASHCPSLAIDAYHAAISVISSDTLDVAIYNDTLSQLNTLLSVHSQPAVDPNVDWIDRSQQTIQTEGNRLDAELRSYKYNSVKDSIRMGYNDLAEHYVRCGDLSNAAKCFIKARDNSTSSKHSVHHTVNLINCYLLLNQMQPVQINLRRLVSEKTAKKSAAVSALEIVIQALVHLHNQAYKSVADTLQKLNLSETRGHIEEIMTTNDVAIIGGVCALAAYSREDLKTLLASQSFRLFLDLEPHIRETISAFVSARYSQSLKLLSTHTGDRLLDLYLWPHVDTLFHKTQHLAMVQYCSPYSTVNLNRMADSFAYNEVQLEEEVANLIMQGSLDMVINSRDKLLRKKTRDACALAFSSVVSTGSSLSLSHRQGLLKMALIQGNLAVSNTQPIGPVYINPDGSHLAQPAGTSNVGYQSNTNNIVLDSVDSR